MTEPATATAQLRATFVSSETANALDTAPPLGDFKIVPEGLRCAACCRLHRPAGCRTDADASAFRNAAKVASGLPDRRLSYQFMPFPAPSMDLSQNQETQLLQSVDPEKTIKARVQASLGSCRRRRAGRRSARTHPGRARVSRSPCTKPCAISRRIFSSPVWSTCRRTPSRCSRPTRNSSNRSWSG